LVREAGAHFGINILIAAKLHPKHILFRMFTFLLANVHDRKVLTAGRAKMNTLMYGLHYEAALLFAWVSGQVCMGLVPCMHVHGVLVKC
jgi:hypothetical protein